MTELKTKADLQLRHQLLHRELDELLACYLGTKPRSSVFGPLVELMEFANLQAQDPSCADHKLAIEWTPTAENINALPDPIRRYIHDLETNVDPAGNIRELAVTKENAAAFAQQSVELRLINADLRDVLKEIIAGFEAGIFVRDISKDAEPDWAMKLLPFLKTLAKAQAAIAKADGR